MQPQPPAGRVLAGRRADAGTVRLGERDITGLMLCADHYGAPSDLLAAALGVRLDRLRAIVARWRHAGYAETGTLGPGPAWCWLTSTGMKQTGLGYPATRPALGRLAHIRAVLAVRLWLEAGEVYQDGRAWWRSGRVAYPALDCLKPSLQKVKGFTRRKDAWNRRRPLRKVVARRAPVCRRVTPAGREARRGVPGGRPPGPAPPRGRGRRGRGG